MDFSTYSILIISALLAVETLFSLCYFRYSYFIELKRRYAYKEIIPYQYKKKLVDEISVDDGLTRFLVQLLYIPWVLFCLFSQFIYLPIILSLFILIVNKIYLKAYVSPLVFFLGLLVNFGIFLFPIIEIILRFVK
jgi:hypothetical protein